MEVKQDIGMNIELSDPPILLMNENRIKRAVDRMAYQIAEDRGGGTEITIIGIKKRGFAVADRLAEKLAMLSEGDLMLMQLPDVEDGEVDFKAEFLSKPPEEIEYGILIDDVIFSGQTMIEAIKTISLRFNPSILRTAVLVDRGHRSMPVEASFTGMQFPTKLDEHVRVQINNERLEKVVLTREH